MAWLRLQQGSNSVERVDFRRQKGYRRDWRGRMRERRNDGRKRWKIRIGGFNALQAIATFQGEGGTRS